MELIKVKVLPPEKEDWIVKVGGQEVPLHHDPKVHAGSG